tara:strand:- start:1175 stop:1546 length:372 start_codon:yes stop_codon:yes gene_type:complete
MALTTSTISENLFTTISEESDLGLSLVLFNNANTTIYAMEFVNPNTTPVYVRHIWGTNPALLSTSTDFDNCYLIPGSGSFSVYCGTGYLVTSGIIMWASTQTGTQTLSAPTSPVTVKIAYKNT